MKNMKVLYFLLVLLSAGCPVMASEPAGLSVAVAANFSRPAEWISTAFTKKTGIVIKLAFSSTGKLYAQIRHGAPFDIFLSADCRRPDLLYRDGLADRPLIYARGQAVLWTGIMELCDESRWQAVITGDRIKRISISHPETAPYGDVAARALKKTDLWKKVADRLIFAGSVSQAFQYAWMRGADAGFTSLSYALGPEGVKGCYWPIPEAPPVIQEVCILKRTQKRRAAEKFLNFLTSGEIRHVLAEYGYR